MCLEISNVIYKILKKGIFLYTGKYKDKNNTKQISVKKVTNLQCGLDYYYFNERVVKKKS